MEMWDILDENGNSTGRTCEKTINMAKGDYHLVVHVWIMNSAGDFLISRRAAHKAWGLLWEPTAGSVAAGDGSIETAAKETQEELGIELDLQRGKLFKRIRRDTLAGLQDFVDIWLFRQDFALEDAVINPDEVCDVMWAGQELILEMTGRGEFLGEENCPYLEEFFASR